MLTHIFTSHISNNNSICDIYQAWGKNENSSTDVEITIEIYLSHSDRPCHKNVEQG